MDRTCLRWLLAGLVALAAAGTAAGEAPARIVVKFDMAVDAEGRPTTLTPPPGLPPSIVQSVDAWAHTLRFQPATVDGVPQPSTSTLYLTFAHTSEGDDMRVAALATGPRLLHGSYDATPDFDGAAYFLVDYDASGRVTRVALDEVNSPRSSGGFQRWANRLVKSFTVAPETVAGQGVPGRARIPVIYCSGRRGCPELPPIADPSEKDLAGDMMAPSVLSLAPGN